MAKVARGSGQGKVRQYKSGVMVKCSDADCIRRARFIFLGAKPAEKPTWNCGLKPLLPKLGRVGQQKQTR